MERSTHVLDIADKLHEVLDPSAQNLSPLQVGTVIRAAAELTVDEVTEERVAALAYLQYHCGYDPRVVLVIQQMELGAHRRNRSQSMEAVVERG